jgi:hypothetical protein
MSDHEQDADVEMDQLEDESGLNASQAPAIVDDEGK